MPTRHLELAPAKLTRSLRVEGLRADGYHLLRAEMVTVSLADELEIEEGDGLEVIDEVAWHNGAARRAIEPVAPGDDNLVRRALAAVGRTARVRLHKKIPHGAGLGGGSADAAAVLRWAGCTEVALAAQLGADVPFCLRGGRALVTGIGEVLEPLTPIELAFVLVTPDLAVSTPAVYRAFDELGAGDRAVEANDLERAAIRVVPELREVRDRLGALAGRRAQLAGSGSTFFVECATDELDELVERVRAGWAGSGGCASIAATRTAITA